MATVKVLCLVRAKFPYKGNEAEGQLAFNAGDVFPITTKEPTGWWEGVIDGRIGWCPSTFLETLAASGVAQAIEQAPKTVRVSADKAAQLLASLQQQEDTAAEQTRSATRRERQQGKQKAAKEGKAAKRPIFFLKKRDSGSKTDAKNERDSKVARCLFRIFSENVSGDTGQERVAAQVGQEGKRFPVCFHF
jgi:hypothetical protein